MAYFEKNKVTDANGNTINPATDESIILLRRMVKLLESQSATDIGNRQRVTIDAGILPTVTTVGSVTSVGSIGAGAAIIGFVNQDQRQFIDIARNNYANAIRSKLTFS